MPEFQKLINKQLNPLELAAERKDLIKKIQDEHGRKLMIYASDNTKEKSPYLINQEDITPFSDMITSLIKADKVSVLIHSSGGFAEVAEMIVSMLRSKFTDVDFIVPRYAKSAATMMVCSGDQILMDYRSELGPIDPQIAFQGKRFAADAFTKGFKKILDETKGQKLNPAYLPILRNITPADLQTMENAKKLSCSLVETWLIEYMFKGLSTAEGKSKAKKISDWLGDHGAHLSHGKPITMKEATEQGLNIIDYSQYKKLSSYIWRLYCNIELSFSMTNVYKIYETESVQLLKQIEILQLGDQKPSPKDAKLIKVNSKCNKCNSVKVFQMNFEKGLNNTDNPYPKNDKYVCEKCGNHIDLKQVRLKAEGMTGKKTILE